MKPRHLTEEDLRAMQARVRKAGPVGAGADSQGAGAHSKVSPVTSSPYAPYANKWEFNFAKVLDLQLRAKEIRSWEYAGITFTLAKRQYHRIDFIIGHNDFSVEIAQVKGYHKNMRAGIKGLKWAAQKWPMFTWTIKRWTGTGWDGSYVEV